MWGRRSARWLPPLALMLRANQLLLEIARRVRKLGEDEKLSPSGGAD